MQSKVVRDGTLGILILVGIGIFGSIALWLRGARLGDNRFTFIVKLPDATGLNVGSPVRFRGVSVGRVKSLKAASEIAEVVVEVDNAQLIMPRESVVETNQSGFLGNTTIDIAPKVALSSSEPSFLPLSQNCNKEKVICLNSSIDGEIGVSFNELIKESAQIARKLNNQGLIENIDKTLTTVNGAAKSIQKLTESANRVIGAIEDPLKKFSGTADAISQAANNIGETASNANGLMNENKQKISQTLDNLSAASQDAKALIAGTRPLVENGEFVGNLQKLSQNAAAASDNLKTFSGEINNPNTISTLRETLDSARATFANTQKITADLDELTGDPKFRSGIRNLVNGLSGLLSLDPEMELKPTANSTPAIVLPETTAIAKTKSPTKDSEAKESKIPKIGNTAAPKQQLPAKLPESKDDQSF